MSEEHQSGKGDFSWHIDPSFWLGLTQIQALITFDLMSHVIKPFINYALPIALII